MSEREQSGQASEDDDGRAGAREGAEESPGVPEDDEQGTGNPGAAGSSDPDDED